MWVLGPAKHGVGGYGFFYPDGEVDLEYGRKGVMKVVGWEKWWRERVGRAWNGHRYEEGEGVAGMWQGTAVWWILSKKNGSEELSLSAIRSPTHQV
ncbi:hypothetical protein ACH5RR_010662 [Cinchona calisaya]|uniref:Uncharacterized protein n=1 Tax=Cinchona calisaya TaxID=153742 RepID=A0ABD3AJK4_9GENT